MGARRYLAAAAYFLLAGGSFTFAQAVADRISTEVNPLALSSIKGSTPPVTKFATSSGAMSSGTRLEGMTLRFSLTSTQKAELDALLEAQQTPGSPSYHQWLTPAEYARRFGISDNDLAKIKSWLEQQGFSVESINNSRTALRFSGTVGQVESAFNTQMRTYSLADKSFFANASEVSIPAALSGVVTAVGNLNSLRPQPHLKMKPNFTSSSSGNHYMTPSDVATIYDVKAATSAGYTGSGQAIAVIGQSAIVSSDITNFQTALGWTTTKAPTLVLVPGSGSSTIASGDEAESDLDLEYTSTVASGATIYFVYTGSSSSYSVWDAIEYAVDTRIAPIISLSYGACEAGMSNSDFSSLDTIMQQGATQGQSIIISSGDDGSAGCGYLYENYGSSYLSYAKTLSADYPASSNYVTAIGGTEFPSSYVSSSNTTYWSSSSGSDVISSALSYIPEVVWNDSSSSGLSSGGGGVSIYSARPSWQSSSVPGITSTHDYSGGMRMVPDISLDSSPDDAGYLYCSSDSTATGISGSCSNGFRASNGSSLTVAGGTSFAAPIFAGMLAILNQAKNYDYQGLINSELYTLASNSTYYSEAFHDITSGNNACTGVSYCSTSTSSYYSAATGYDEATGLGSIDFYELMSIWPTNSTASSSGTTPTYSSTTTLSAASSTATSGTADVITITVASGSSSSTATPTGTLTIYVDGTSKTSSLTLSGGMATYSFSSTTSGVHTIVAIYSGDSTYFASTGSTVVTVGSSSTSSTGSFTVSLASSSVTIKSGSSGTDTVTVTPSNGYTGTVAWSASASSTYIQNYACYTISSASVTGTSAVSKTLTLYMGTSACSSASTANSNLKSFKAAGSVQQAQNHAPTHSNLLPVSMASLGAIGMLLAGLAGRRRRALRAVFGMMALAFVGLALTACGSSTASSSSSSSSGTNVPTGTYTITLTGTDSSSSSITSSATLTVVVD